MPASNERVPNRHLSGTELREIIEKDVHSILTRDGMFSNHLGFARVAYEVRVSIHLDNPMYPHHVSTIESKKASIQQVDLNPALEAIETPPLHSTSGEEVLFSEELHRQILSPNAARVENDMPLTIDRRNLDTGAVEQVQQKFKGEPPDPAAVGNVKSDKNTTEDQRNRWGKQKR